MSTLPANPLKSRLLASSDLLQMIREDRQTNLGWGEPGFHALAVYRVGRWAREAEDAPAWVRRGAAAAARMGARVAHNVYGIDLPPTADIGRRVVVQEHSVAVHPNSVVGDGCILRKGATLGGTTGGEDMAEQAPVLGAGVSVGVHAVIAGKVTVGDHASIGPNVAILRNIPSGATVVAPRPRIIRGISSYVPEETPAEAAQTEDA